jgi:hypothetical protein
LKRKLCGTSFTTGDGRIFAIWPMFSDIPEWQRKMCSQPGSRDWLGESRMLENTTPNT